MLFGKKLQLSEANGKSHWDPVSRTRRNRALARVCHRLCSCSNSLRWHDSILQSNHFFLKANQRANHTCKHQVMEVNRMLHRLCRTELPTHSKAEGICESNKRHHRWLLFQGSVCPNPRPDIQLKPSVCAGSVTLQLFPQTFRLLVGRLAGDNPVSVLLMQQIC